jgi:hydrogenase maturation factor
MNFIDEYRHGEIARRLTQQIARLTDRRLKVMEVCGGHTHTIFKYGIEDLLPHNIEMMHGPGSIAHSGLKLRSKYAEFDAELKYRAPGLRIADPKACQFGEILKGVKKPWECKVFGTACTPETPIGSCMVSSEGACAAYYNFGRLSKVAGPPAAQSSS